MRIFYINIYDIDKYNKMCSLTILSFFILKENKLSVFWVVQCNRSYMNNNNFYSITLYQLLYNVIWYHTFKLYQICKQYPCSIFYQLFVILYETRYDQHNYFWYSRPTVIGHTSIHFKDYQCFFLINQIWTAVRSEVCERRDKKEISSGSVVRTSKTWICYRYYI